MAEAHTEAEADTDKKNGHKSPFFDMELFSASTVFTVSASFEFTHFFFTVLFEFVNHILERHFRRRSLFFRFPYIRS